MIVASMARRARSEAGTGVAKEEGKSERTKLGGKTGAKVRRYIEREERREGGRERKGNENIRYSARGREYRCQPRLIIAALRSAALHSGLSAGFRRCLLKKLVDFSRSSMIEIIDTAPKYRS